VTNKFEPLPFEPSVAREVRFGLFRASVPGAEGRVDIQLVDDKWLVYGGGTYEKQELNLAIREANRIADRLFGSPRFKLIVAGSRDIDFQTSKDAIRRALKATLWWRRVTEIVHGAARGVDSHADTLFREVCPVTRFPANWELGRSAGAKRNTQMAEFADGLIAIWDGRSRGTKHMIDVAKKNRLEVHVEIVAKAT
jgi:hypothetical protein